ncbi:MAG: helix-turn-helix transcriptional regulator [Clostridia bacterium]|nr:helix-turn-helix transcriptional regulator [Clostridia bacterium]MBQ8792007.1 helix-turn-helix transcriptional regulator [Clostridia bacterium]
MTLNEAIKKRILELVEERNISLTSLCLNSNLTPSTLFEFMYKKTKFPTIITIKKICYGAGITLEEFFSPSYFNDFDDVVK